MTDIHIRDVLAWARTKPADQTYDYQASGNCALCHFLRETGRSRSPVVRPHLPDGRGGFWTDPDMPISGYPLGLEYALAGPEGIERQTSPYWTYGELVKRLELLLPAKPISDTWTRPDAYLTDMVEA